MTRYDIALLLAIVGGTYLLTALIGKATGDAHRDVLLMGGLGVTLGSIAAALHLA
jgi:hypothetical protein